MSLLFTAVVAASARADISATWQGATSDWYTGSNWSLGVPLNRDDATAIFGATGVTAVTLDSNNVEVSTINFLTGASSYTFAITQGHLAVKGTGITNNSGTTQTFSITNFGFIDFSGSATAGSASYQAISNAGFNFANTATGGSANFDIGSTAYMAFYDSSTAGSGTFTGLGEIYFATNSSAANATFNLSSGGRLYAQTDGALSIGALQGNGTFNLTNSVVVGGLNTNTTFAGSLTGAGGLTKTGTGSLTLTNTNPSDNNYSGATIVNGGKLLINGRLNSPGAVQVNAGGTLGGHGYITGATTIAAGGHLLAPATGYQRLVFTGDLTLLGGAVLDFPLGSESGHIAVDGTWTGPSSGLITVNLSNAGDFGAGSYLLMTSNSATGLDLSKFVLGTTIPGYTYTLGFDGNNLSVAAAVSAIPEPSTYAAIAGGCMLGLAVWRRRAARAQAGSV